MEQIWRTYHQSKVIKFRPISLLVCIPRPGQFRHHLHSVPHSYCFTFMSQPLGISSLVLVSKIRRKHCLNQIYDNLFGIRIILMEQIKAVASTTSLVHKTRFWWARNVMHYKHTNRQRNVHAFVLLGKLTVNKLLQGVVGEKYWRDLVTATGFNPLQQPFTVTCMQDHPRKISRMTHNHAGKDDATCAPVSQIRTRFPYVFIFFEFYVNFYTS